MFTGKVLCLQEKCYVYRKSVKFTGKKSKVYRKICKFYRKICKFYRKIIVQDKKKRFSGNGAFIKFRFLQ